jgi:hypothetical protein
MAIKLSANYSKKLGLPQYSSHSFSASVEVELTDITQVEAEVQKLYQLLQHSVDQEIQHAGFIPGSDGHSNGRAQPQPNGNGRSYPVQQNGRSSNGSNGHPQPVPLGMPGTAPTVSAGSSCASSATTRSRSRRSRICPSSSSAPA